MFKYFKISSSLSTTLMYSSWWRHQIETSSTLLAICAGIHRSPVNSPHEGQWRRTLMFSLICPWINGWVNNREAGDLRRQYQRYCTEFFLTLGNRTHRNLRPGLKMLDWTLNVCCVYVKNSNCYVFIYLRLTALQMGVHTGSYCTKTVINHSMNNEMYSRIALQ